MLSMSHGWRALRGGLLEGNDGGGTILLGTSMGADPLSGVHGGVGGDVYGGIFPSSTRESLFPQWEENPKPLDPRIYIVYFPRAAESVGCPVEG